MSFDVGLYGLAVMGQNFALNMAEHGFKVAVYNRSLDKVDHTVERAKAEGGLPLKKVFFTLQFYVEGFKTAEDFVKAIKTPRREIIYNYPNKSSFLSWQVMIHKYLIRKTR